MPRNFDDLIAANRAYAQRFPLRGFDGVAHAGVALVTASALEALVLGVHLLNVRRILIVPHTRCAMTSKTEQQLRALISTSSGQDASWQSFHVVDNQENVLHQDVAAVRAHPLIPNNVIVGGFIYDVDTGLLERRE